MIGVGQIILLLLIEESLRAKTLDEKNKTGLIFTHPHGTVEALLDREDSITWMFGLTYSTIIYIIHLNPGTRAFIFSLCEDNRQKTSPLPKSESSKSSRGSSIIIPRGGRPSLHFQLIMQPRLFH